MMRVTIMNKVKKSYSLFGKVIKRSSDGHAMGVLMNSCE